MEGNSGTGLVPSAVFNSQYTAFITLINMPVQGRGALDFSQILCKILIELYFCE